MSPSRKLGFLEHCTFDSWTWFGTKPGKRCSFSCHISISLQLFGGQCCWSHGKEPRQVDGLRRRPSHKGMRKIWTENLPSWLLAYQTGSQIASTHVSFGLRSLARLTLPREGLLLLRSPIIRVSPVTVMTIGPLIP